MRVVDLFESVLMEDARSDYAAREKAMDAADAVLKYLVGVSLPTVKLFQKGPYVGFSVDSKRIGSSEDFTLTVVQVTDKQIDSSGRMTVYGGYNSRKNEVVVYVPDITETQSIMRDMKFVMNLRKTLVHELIHKFDWERSGGRLPTNGMDTVEGYYNSPAEFNAHYQEALYTITNSIEGRFKNDRALKSDYRYFRNFFDGAFNQDFLKNLDQRNRQRLEGRLYQYWSEYVREQIVETVKTLGTRHTTL